MLKKFEVYNSTDYRKTECLAVVQIEGDKTLVDMLESELRELILTEYEVE